MARPERLHLSKLIFCLSVTRSQLDDSVHGVLNRLQTTSRIKINMTGDLLVSSLQTSLVSQVIHVSGLGLPTMQEPHSCQTCHERQQASAAVQSTVTSRSQHVSLCSAKHFLQSFAWLSFSSCFAIGCCINSLSFNSWSSPLFRCTRYVVFWFYCFDMQHASS